MKTFTMICSNIIPLRPDTGLLSMASRHLITRVLSMAALGLSAVGSGFAQTYRVTQVNPPAGAYTSNAIALNDLGQVVGNTSLKSGKSTVAGPPYMWDASNGPVVLPFVGSDKDSTALGISNSGLIVGYSPFVYSLARAVWWRPNPSGNGYSAGDWNVQVPGFPCHLRRAVGVTQDGQFVLFDASNKISGHQRAVVARVGVAGIEAAWSIDTLGMGGELLRYSNPIAIHYDGTGTVRVLCYARTMTQPADSPRLHIVWQKTKNLTTGVFDDDYTMVTLDPLPGTDSSPYGINGRGEIVGYYARSTWDDQRGYLWEANGTFQTIPGGDGPRNIARAVNDEGFVVGWYRRNTRDKLSRCYLWHRDTPLSLRDLGSLVAPGDTFGVELTDALKINNAGQILATGVENRNSVDILLIPVR